MQTSGGVHLPPDIVKGRHVFFAIHNVDFSKDTHHGKRSPPRGSHANISTVSSRRERAWSHLMYKCPKQPQYSWLATLTDRTSWLSWSPSRPPCTTYPAFSIETDRESSLDLSLPDVTWLFGRTTQRLSISSSDGSTQELNVPPWSPCQSMVSSAVPVNRVGAQPLIALPAHKWLTFLSVLKQAHDNKTAVVGFLRNTIITLDLGLCQPAKQLQTCRTNLNSIILHPGHLHIVMAQLRTIGSYIENSGER